MIFSMAKAYPTTKNLHETIEENHLMSKIGSVAGRKQKPFLRDCKPFRFQEKLPNSE